MEILHGGRRSGKTIALIEYAHKHNLYIVCSSRQRVEHIAKTAEKLGLDIPFPISARELPLGRSFIEKVLVDDMEDILRVFVGKPIELITTSCEVREIGCKEGLDCEDVYRDRNKKY